jgi:hypothetical protein
MTSPIRSRDDQLYTPSEPEDLVCRSETSHATDVERATGSDPEPIAGHGVDFLTLSVGAGAIIGGDVSVTLDRFGHLYVGAGAGVGVSATIASASAHAGQMTEPIADAPNEKKVRGFLEGDAVEVNAAIGAEVGVTSSPGGTAAELGVGLVQASAQFQHNWHVLQLPIRW